MRSSPPGSGVETAHLYEDQTSSKKDDRPGLAAGLKVLTDQGATFDTTTAASKLVFGIFAALADFKLELISERAMAGMASARAGAAWAAGSLLCAELGVTRQTFYRHVSLKGELRSDGLKLLGRIS